MTDVEKTRIIRDMVERNPIILSLMMKLGFMIRLGRGILRIFRLDREAGLPEPELTERETEFVS